MKVIDLKNALQNLPDDMRIAITDPDYPGTWQWVASGVQTEITDLVGDVHQVILLSTY